jgi:hypothetical protein
MCLTCMVLLHSADGSNWNDADWYPHVRYFEVNKTRMPSTMFWRRLGHVLGRSAAAVQALDLSYHKARGGPSRDVVTREAAVRSGSRPRAGAHPHPPLYAEGGLGVAGVPCQDSMPAVRCVARCGGGLYTLGVPVPPARPGAEPVPCAHASKGSVCLLVCLFVGRCPVLAPPGSLFACRAA